jgi:hypothetical protein
MDRFSIMLNKLYTPVVEDYAKMKKTQPTKEELDKAYVPVSQDQYGWRGTQVLGQYGWGNIHS